MGRRGNDGLERKEWQLNSLRPTGALCCVGDVCVVVWWCLHSSVRRQRVGHRHIPEQGHCWVRLGGQGRGLGARRGGGLIACFHDTTAVYLQKALLRDAWNTQHTNVLRFGNWSISPVATVVFGRALCWGTANGEIGAEPGLVEFVGM